MVLGKGAHIQVLSWKQLQRHQEAIQAGRSSWQCHPMVWRPGPLMSRYWPGCCPGSEENFYLPLLLAAPWPFSGTVASWASVRLHWVLVIHMYWSSFLLTGQSKFCNLQTLTFIAHRLIRRGSTRTNYVCTPFQAKVRVKLIQICLALPLCDSAAWQR